MGNAALLIDLENFYIGREENYRKTHKDDLYEHPVDLDSLCEFARELAGGRRLSVGRAYANFNDRRPGDGDRRWDYYLQPLPRFLMEQGIEPVQVFRFPGGSNKNAADMRLAMDATALMTGRAKIDLFVLVTGDSDFIPLVLELKRGDAEVVVIGVAGSTKPIFGRYCDRFEYFEDLLAARELQRDGASEFEPLRKALAAMLERRSLIKFAAVKPLLSDELGHPFDPSRFRCDTTGEFLRKHASTLGLTVRRGEHDWEIGAFDPDAKPLPQEPQDPEQQEEDAPTTPSNGLTPHHDDRCDTLYGELLRQGIPRCYVVPIADWTQITDAVFRLCTDTSDAGDKDGESGEDGDRRTVVHQELLASVIETCTDEGVLDANRKVSDVTFQLFKAGCFHCADGDADVGQADFHWSRPARLDVALRDADAMRERTWAFLLGLLDRRLEQRGRSERIDVELLTALFGGEDVPDDQIATLRRLVGELVGT